MAKTTKQILDDDPEMGRLIDSLPEDLLWRAEPQSTEGHPVATIIPVITVRFVNPTPAEYIKVTVSGPE